MTKFSVVIPTFNRAHTLPRALGSVLGQSLTLWEVIVVDDGSTDTTKQVVAECAAKDSRIRYVKTENRGVSAARNTGARLATGKWLAFLDSDDEWLPNKLELQDPLTEKFAWIHGEEIWIRNGNQVNKKTKHTKGGGDVFQKAVDICFISPSTTLIRKDVFESTGGFKEDFPTCEDYELWLRLAAHYPIGFVERPVIKKYGGHADQLSTKFIAMDYYRIKALIPFINSEENSAPARKYVAEAIIKKAGILIHGYRKHDNLENLNEVQTWLEDARNLLTAAHNAHSAIERRPRSEFNGIL